MAVICTTKISMEFNMKRGIIKQKNKRGIIKDKKSKVNKPTTIILINFLLILAGIIFIYASTMTYLTPSPADNSYTAALSKEFNISIDMANLLEVKWNIEDIFNNKV